VSASQALSSFLFKPSHVERGRAFDSNLGVSSISFSFLPESGFTLPVLRHRARTNPGIFFFHTSLTPAAVYLLELSIGAKERNQNPLEFLPLADLSLTLLLLKR